MIEHPSLNPKSKQGRWSLRGRGGDRHAILILVDFIHFILTLEICKVDFKVSLPLFFRIQVF